MRRGLVALCAGLCLLCAARLAYALDAPQASIPFLVVDSAYGIFGSAAVDVRIDAAVSIWPENSSLYEDLRVGAVHSGSQYVIDSTRDDPDFEAFLGLLRNGVDDEIVMTFDSDGVVNEVRVLESSYFGGLGAWPDLKGYEIQRLILRFDVIRYDLSVIWIGFPIFITDMRIEGALLINPPPPLQGITAPIQLLLGE